MTERMPPGLANRQMTTSKWTKRMARSRMPACYQNVQIALDSGKCRNSPWTRKSANRAREILQLCAQSLLNSHSALGAYSRRMCGRLGKPKGIVATAHKLAVLVYRMLRFGHGYTDIG